MDCFWKQFFSQPSLILLIPLVLVTMSRNAIAAQLTLTWNDTSNNELVFKIERKTDTTGTFAEIDQVPTNTTTFIDSTVYAGTTYCYRVRAYNAAGNSGYSNADCGTVPISPYTLTVVKAGTGSGTVSSSPAGIDCGSDCSQTYTGSTLVTLTATAAYGYLFNGWSGGCSGIGSCTLLINTSTNVTATFDTTTSTNYTLTVTKVGSGTVNSYLPGINCGSDCSQSYAAGTSVSLTATPATGYTFSGWSNACTGNGVCFVTLNSAKDVTATFTPTATPTGLVAAYRFGAGYGTTVNDYSGFNNIGTLSNVTWTTSGKFGEALSFNGTNAWVTISDAPSLDLTTGLTLEAWIFPTTTTGTRDIVIKEGNNVDIYNLYARNWRGRPEVNVFVGGTNWVAEGTALAANVWTHVAGTYDGSVVRLFVNGVLVASTTVSGPIATSTGPLRIGGNSLWGEYFQGVIDNVRIYNHALTAAQIQTDMETPVTP
jgi:uncharacterized repeat protein (TIGR02543 family)